MTEHSVKTIGRYVIEREIGRGGMAIVYQAYDPHLDRSVAIKLIRKDAFTGDQLKTLPERFRREARALAKLDHPNIVKVMDYGEHDGDTYLVMEFVKGRTLKDVRKPIRVETAVRLIRPIAEALDYVHEQGILHRDVKPSNLMITPNEKVMLTDFGIAKWLEDENDQFTLTGTGLGIGTPEYMAPEQGLGKKTDERADLYSLAVVFYELITGRKPFLGETPLEVLTKQATEPFPDPRQFVPELNESVTHFFNLALAKKPADRYGSMKDFIRDMDGLRLQSLTQAASAGMTGIRTDPQSEASTESSVRLGKTDIRKIRAAADAMNTPAAESEQDNTALKHEKRRSPWLIPVFTGLAVIAVVAALWLAGDRSGEKSTLTVERTPIAHSSDTTGLGMPIPIISTEAVEAGNINNALLTMTITQTATKTPRPTQPSVQQVLDKILAFKAESEAEWTNYLDKNYDSLLRSAKNILDNKSGTLVHNASDNFIEVYDLVSSIKNFIIEVEFDNPYDPSFNRWNYGIAFRQKEKNDFYELIFNNYYNDGTWELTNRIGTSDGIAIHEGDLDDFMFFREKNQSNFIRLIVINDTGFVFINGQFLSRLNLSDRVTSGELWIGTGFYNGSEVDGYETGFKNLSLWRLSDHVSLGCREDLLWKKADGDENVFNFYGSGLGKIKNSLYEYNFNYSDAILGGMVVVKPPEWALNSEWEMTIVDACIYKESERYPCQLIGSNFHCGPISFCYENNNLPQSGFQIKIFPKQRFCEAYKATISKRVFEMTVNSLR